MSLAQKNKTVQKKILPYLTQYHPALPNLKHTSLWTGSQRGRKKNSAIESVISARPAHPRLHSASSLQNQPGACSQAKRTHSWGKGTLKKINQNWEKFLWSPPPMISYRKGKSLEKILIKIWAMKALELIHLRTQKDSCRPANILSPCYK